MSDSEASTTKLIAGIWTRNQPLILARLNLLRAAAAATADGALTEPQRAEAESIAHKFSGSLGMFGFQQATELARALESEFRSDSPSPDRLSILTESLGEALRLPRSGESK